MEKILEQEEIVSDAISPRAVHLSQHVRLLASTLRDKTEASPFAADTLALSNQVGNLCDYVERLHKSVGTLLATIGEVGSSDAGTTDAELTAEEKKAIEIQRKVHEFRPTVKDAVKALFMWRDSPEQQLRQGK